MKGDDGEEKYLGKVGDPDGAGQAGRSPARRRSSSGTTAAKRIVVDAAGADEKGRGQAAMLVTATLAPTGRGTRVDVVQDLQLSGAAAQYGRGMISRRHVGADARLRRRTCSAGSARIERGLSPDQIAGRGAGQRLRDRPARHAHGAEARLPPVLPALPTRNRRAEEIDSWCSGGSATRSCCSSSYRSLVALLNRVLAALERIRGASDDILAGGVALIGELDEVPEALAKTDRTIHDVSVGAVRYAGSVAKLLG